MKRPFPVTAIVLALGVLALAAYCGLYGVARASKMIIHTTSYAYDPTGRRVTTSHDVTAGDGKLASPNGLVAGLFTPLRAFERLAWNVVDPVWP